MAEGIRTELPFGMEKEKETKRKKRRNKQTILLAYCLQGTFPIGSAEKRKRISQSILCKDDFSGIVGRVS